MFKLTHYKPLVLFIIFSFALFWAPELLRAQEVGRGNIVGYVYGPDNTTPVEGAVVKLRNLSTGSLYESMAADHRGMVAFEGVDEGLYLVGITTARGDFNIENLIGIKPDRTARISFGLRPQEQEGTAQNATKRCPKGEWYVPEIQGQCDENYNWNPETERCECKKRGPLAFFLTPLGAGLVVAASAGVVAVSISGGGESSGSAFK